MRTIKFVVDDEFLSLDGMIARYMESGRHCKKGTQAPRTTYFSIVFLHSPGDRFPFDERKEDEKSKEERNEKKI